MLKYDAFATLCTQKVKVQHWKRGRGGNIWINFPILGQILKVVPTILSQSVWIYLYPRTMQKEMQLTPNFQWCKVLVKVTLHDSLERIQYNGFILWRHDFFLPPTIIRHIWSFLRITDIYDHLFAENHVIKLKLLLKYSIDCNTASYKVFRKIQQYDVILWRHNCHFMTS